MEYSIKKNIFLITLLFMSCFAITARSQDKERKIKTAFIYNFCRFIEWPSDKISDSNEPFLIGVLGDSSIKQVLDGLNDKEIEGKKILVQHISGFSDSLSLENEDDNQIQGKLKKLDKYHLLYVSKSEKEHLQKLIPYLEKNNILTVSHCSDFLNAGGIINFVIEEQRVKFEVNKAAAERSNLETNSKMLRLATKVIEKDDRLENKSVDFRQTQSDKFKSIQKNLPKQANEMYRLIVN